MNDPVIIEVRFAGRPTFAGTRGGDAVEWPPAPARVFAALVAGARGRFNGALRALEHAPAPDIAVPESIALDPYITIPPSRRDQTGPSPKNPSTLTESRGGLHLGRTSFPDMQTADVMKWGGIPHTTVTPRELVDPVVRFIVDGAALDDDQVRDLDTAARDVGYVGRSTDAAMVTVSRGPVPDDDLTLLRPTGRAGRVRVWAPGYLAALDDRFDRQMTTAHAPAVVPRSSYATTGYLPVAQAPAGDLVLVRVSPSMPPRRAVTLMSRLDGAVPLVNPHNDHLVGLAADDADSLLDVLDDADVDVDVPASYWAETIAGTGREWATAWPAHLPADGALAWAWVARDVSAATGLDVVDLDIDLEPAPRAGDGAPLTPGLQRWAVRVRLPEPVTGPLRVGPDATPLYREWS